MTIAHFKQLDWDFPEQNSRKFLHNLCWYPSRFIPMIPAQLIAALSEPNDSVLDPFGGSGTVLIEALRQNRKGICIDSNPLGCFIAEVKARICSGEYFNLEILSDLSSQLETLDIGKKEKPFFSKKNQLLKLVNSPIPNRNEIKPWYHKDTLNDLSAIFNFIILCDHELTAKILKLLFLSILIPTSGHKSGKPYTYYADNVKPKEMIKKDAFKLYNDKLKRFISEYKEWVDNREINNYWDVYCEDSRRINEFISEPIDLIVTSPPYLSVTDYNTAFRLAHLWFDWNSDLIELKKTEIGSRSRRKNKNSVQEYLTDMEICFREMVRCLKKNKYLCLVLGESKKHSSLIKDNIIPYLIEDLKLKDIYSASREISQKFFLHQNGGVNTEDILVFRKVKNG